LKLVTNRDGVLFNDAEADALRYAGRGEGQRTG
jgi:hypothetical protein